MKSLGGYKLVSCPRYLTGVEQAKTQNAAMQVAFWNALNVIVLLRHRCAIEMRLVANAASRCVEPFLLFWDPSTNNEETESLSLAEVLPPQYEWEQLDQQGVEGILGDGVPWHLVRCSRRLDYVDLPTVATLFASRAAGRQQTSSSTPAPTAKAGAVSGGSAAVSGRTEPHPQPPTPNARSHPDNGGHPPPEPGSSGVFGALGVGAAMLSGRNRFLPDLHHHFMDPGDWPDLCVPIVGEIQENIAGDDQFFQQMIRSAPSMHSVAVFPDDSSSLLHDQMVATRWRRFVEPFIHVIASTGIAPVSQVRSVYDRYWLPRGQLVKLSMFCAAGTGSHALAIAQAASARFGGMRAFQIGTPRQLKSSRPRLRDPTVDPNGEENALKLVKQTMEAAGIAVPSEEYGRFLHRMPHLFSLDEAFRLLRLPYTDHDGLPGLETRSVTPFSDSVRGFRPFTYSPPRAEIRIGLTASSETASPTTGRDRPQDGHVNWHALDTDDLTKHAFITGSTGSGKSTVTKFIAGEVLRAGVPLMVIEPVKGEYHAAIRDLLAFQEDPNGVVRRCVDAGSEGFESEDFLAFDPMTVPRGVTVARHIAYLKGCFQAAFPMEESAALVLENGLWAYYSALNFGPFHKGSQGMSKLVRYPVDSALREKALKEKLYLRDSDGRYNSDRRIVLPSFESFVQHFLLLFLPDELNAGSGKDAAARNEEWKQFFRRRFRNLMLGPLGVCFRRANDAVRRHGPGAPDPIEQLLKANCVIELEALADEEQKSLAMAFLLTALYERRQADGNGPVVAGERLQHVLVIEEAHRLLSSGATTSRGGEMAGMTAQGRAIRLFTDMLAEIRSYGEGLIIVEQIPTKIAPEVLKNTNLKIMLRLNSADDREFLGRAMGLREEHLRFVSSLKRGQMVVFNDSLDQPVLLDAVSPDRWAMLFSKGRSA